VRFALTAAADTLWPAGQVEQAWIVAQRETALGLPATDIRQADQAEAGGALATEGQ